jgi:hypothetical protein
MDAWLRRLATGVADGVSKHSDHHVSGQRSESTVCGGDEKIRFLTKRQELLQSSAVGLQTDHVGD